MRLISTICLLNLFVFSQTELHQLSRLPRLLEHFLEHRQENPNISFWSFLDMHYQHGSPVDKDFAKDQRLPFKSVDCNTAMTLAVLPTTEITLPAWVYFSDRIQEALQTEPLCSRATTEIWQPPRRSYLLS